MPRKLKYHEQKLLKKVDFLNWKADGNLREVKILRRYHIQDREDYHTYNKICGMITSVRACAFRVARACRRDGRRTHRSPALAPLAPQLTTMLKKMDQRDPVRIEMTDQLLDKLYGLGLIQHKRLLACDQIAASTLCRRRLPVVLVRLKFAETLREAATLVEQGHIRIGPETVTDPAYIVTRHMEDYITWVDTSRIKRHVMKYNDKLDDYDLL